MALATRYKTKPSNSPTGTPSGATYGPTGAPYDSEKKRLDSAVEAVQNATSYATPTANVTNQTTQSNQSRISNNYDNYYSPTGKSESAYQRMLTAQLGDPGDFEESEYTEKYRNKLTDVENSKPDAFTSKYSEQIASLLDSIYNQKEFSYNPTMDEGFQNYREMYQNNARRAMQDTMGQAAQLTGGYGSTAAQTAAQQSYDQTMSGLNDKYLDFWDRAYQKYRDNVSDQYNKLGAFNNQDNIDYSRYRDDVTDWQTDRSYYAGQLANSQNYDLNVYNADLSHYQNNRDYYTSLYNTETANDQWDKQFALNRETQDYQNMLNEQAIQKGGIETAMAQDQYDMYNYYRQLGYNYTQAMNLMKGLNPDGTAIGSGRSGGRGGSSKKNSSKKSSDDNASKPTVNYEDVLQTYYDLQQKSSGTVLDAVNADEYMQYVKDNYNIDRTNALLHPVSTQMAAQQHVKKNKK